MKRLGSIALVVMLAATAFATNGTRIVGFNAKTIGICMIGTSQYSAAQWKALDNLVAGLQKEYPAAKVLGHRDLSPDLNGNGVIEPDEWTKTCPGFDVKKWLTEGVPEDSVLNEQ